MTAVWFYFNNEGWPILRPGPRQVSTWHIYLRAIVPPASDGTLNTLQAIRQVETYVAGLLAAPSPAAPSPAPAPTPMPSPANTGFGPLPPCVSLQSFENWHRELREAFDEHAHIEMRMKGTRCMLMSGSLTMSITKHVASRQRSSCWPKIPCGFLKSWSVGF